MESKKHLNYYIILGVILALLSYPFIWLVHNYTVQSIGAGVSSLLFVTWAIVHHINEGRVRKTVIGEYILLGVVIFLVVFAILTAL